MPNGIFSFDLSSAPAEVAELYASELAGAMRSDGMDSKTADTYAMQQVGNAGWYQTGGGWKRLGPDVREKVNMRRAELQPNGTYLIRDVDVFYANDLGRTADGKKVEYTADDVKAHISRTNESIASGGQRPALCISHPHPLNKVGGVAIMANGGGVNFRQSPRRADMARCDLVDVTADFVQKCRNREITGLSAGCLEDGRFGHIAALGAESQRLPELPQMMVYSDENTIFFSAEPMKGSDMPLPTNPTKKIGPSAIFTAIATAYSAIETGKDKDGSGLKTVFSDLAKADFEMSQGCVGTEIPEPTKLNVGDGKDILQADVTVGGGKETAKPAAEVHHEDEPAMGTAFAAQNKEIETLRGQLKQAVTAINGLTGKAIKAEFSTFIKEQQMAGLQFDADSKIALFDAMVSTGNAAGIEAIKADILKSPKSPLLGVGRVFAAGDAAPTGLSGNAAVEEALKANGGNYSADEVQLGADFMKAMGGMKN